MAQHEGEGPEVTGHVSGLAFHQSESHGTFPGHGCLGGPRGAESFIVKETIPGLEWQLPAARAEGALE